MPQASSARAQKLRDVAEQLHLEVCDLQELADQLAQPSRSIARAEQLIAAGERIASQLNDCAARARRIFRG